jgi:hypothetical protein
VINFLRVAYLSFIYAVNFLWFSLLIALVSVLTMDTENLSEFIFGVIGMFLVVALPLLSIALVLDGLRIRKYFLLTKKLNVSYFYFLSLNKMQQENLFENMKKVE